MTNTELFYLDGKNVHVSTNYGAYFTGYANIAGEYLIVGIQEYLIHYSDISSIREV
jgi:hypothetical protein